MLCVCISIRPGVIYLPEASITLALGASIFLVETWVITLLSTRTFELYINFGERPSKYFTFVNKSWIASITWLITGGCLVDNGYRWELILNLINTSKFQVDIKWWQKIIQWVVREVEYCIPEEIDNDEYIADTIRGEGWFGSTWV